MTGITLGELDALANTIVENETLSRHIKDNKQTLKNKLEHITLGEKKRINWLRFNRKYGIQ
jgi:hypothetical protein